MFTLIFGLQLRLPTRNTSFAKNRKKYEGKKIAFVSISVDTKMIMKNGSLCDC
jgi:hypothetical protein